MAEVRTQADLDQVLREAGLPEGSVVLAAPPDEGAPPPPSGPWVVVPYGHQFVVGGMARNKFRPYASLWSIEDAVDLAVRLVSTPARCTPGGDPEALRARGAATADAINDRVRAGGGAARPTAVGAGDVLDCLEPETAHHLYALGTPFPQRSQPPTAIGGPYHRYEVVQELPGKVMEGVAAPWFGQPGGGAMVVLDAPIRWYVDQGFLVELT